MSLDTEFVKKSITIPVDIYHAAQPFVVDGNFSAFVTQSIRKFLSTERLTAWIAEYEAEHGVIPQEEVDECAKRLFG
ncbi:MAG: hypothetical protein LBK28_04625 [Propionibacteriaceae bacterium]|jgi:hypothetical protein|nr:hypothetical protein [Propionibacteriaceae bacterium]